MLRRSTHVVGIAAAVFLGGVPLLITQHPDPTRPFPRPRPVGTMEKAARNRPGHDRSKDFDAHEPGPVSPALNQ